MPAPRVLRLLPLLVLFALSFNHCFAQAATSPAPRPEWIWRSEKPRENEVLYFRKTFEISGPIKSATLAASCDDALGLFVNGQHLAEHSEWRQPLRENVLKHLRQGTNVLGTRGRNAADSAGLLVELRIEFADGRTQIITSDASWRVTEVPGDTWQRADYDDNGWQKSHSFGQLGVNPWGLIAFFAPPSSLATPQSAITVPDGFKAELLYTVPKESQGSWVSMTSDPVGRLITSDQDGSLYRVTPGSDAASTKVEKLDVAIGQAHGLLYAFDSLYVMVNGNAAEGSGLYRVRDTKGNGQFDEVKLLKKIEGSGEHGPHAIRLGPDGKLWVIVGNHTNLPKEFDATSPLRNYAEDHLLPRNPDGRGHATGRMAPGGWIARTDKDCTHWELFCGGFRNAYDFGFNQDGELFTFDADMEWDTGAPWYRPTRVNHCVSAAEFGWRYGTGKWPDYYADSLGAVVDIGLGSPTGVEFGTGARFPEKYQRAFFVNDWTYGKIYAVQMQPAGASYTATFETFVQAKPLPVTDLVINRDGHLYFLIGGRKTQSGLYRVSYIGSESTAPAKPLANPKATAARELRRKLETFHTKKSPDAIAAAWPHLNSTDRNLRFAARVAIENQNVALWQDKALAEPRTTASIHALLALARVGAPSLQGKIVGRLNALPFARLTEEQLLAATRAYSLSFIRQGTPDERLHVETVAKLNPLYPAQSLFVNRELCNVLVYLEAPDVAARSMALLSAADTQQDQLAYAFVLRNLRTGWTLDQRRAYFSWLNLAETKYKGGASFQKFVQQIRNDAVAKLSEDDQAKLKDVIEGKQNVQVVKLETTRQFVHNWQIEDVISQLDLVEKGRSFEKGKAAYEAAQCAKCHRFAGTGGDTGPDVTAVGNRFSSLYLLESLIVPSKAISDQYLNTIIQTTDGDVLTGRVIEETAQHVKLRTDPFARELMTLPKAKIEDRKPSTVSEMPQGLINVLTKDDILDLLAYLRSGGNSEDKAFAK